MNQIVPYSKLSKKAKRVVNNRQRGTWEQYGVNPITRVEADKKKEHVKRMCRGTNQNNVREKGASWYE